MRTLFVTDPPPVVEDWLAQRRALGQRRFDEVWEGEYHVAPAPHRRHARLDDLLGRLLGPWADAAGLLGATTCNIGPDPAAHAHACIYRHAPARDACVRG